jgi:hypothetical protein
MSEKNAEIKAAIDGFDLTTARQLLRDALKEADAETYFLASRAAVDDEQKREFLEKAVKEDPFHEQARAALNKLKNPQPPASPTLAVGSSPAELSAAAAAPSYPQSAQPPLGMQPLQPPPSFSQPGYSPSYSAPNFQMPGSQPHGYDPRSAPMLAQRAATPFSIGALIGIGLVAAFIAAIGNLVMLQYLIDGRPGTLSEFRLIYGVLLGGLNLCLFAAIGSMTRSSAPTLSSGTIWLCAAALAALAFGAQFVTEEVGTSDFVEWALRISSAGVIAFFYSELNSFSANVNDRRWSIGAAIGVALAFIGVDFVSSEIAHSAISGFDSLTETRVKIALIAGAYGAVVGALIFVATFVSRPGGTYPNANYNTPYGGPPSYR